MAAHGRTRARARRGRDSLRACGRRDWPYVRVIVAGWLLNHSLWTFMLLVFLIYGCHYQTVYNETDNSEALIISWLWSVAQRFVVNEPVLIFVGLGLPLLFATECCANFFTESCNNFLGVLVQVIITFFKMLKKIT